jgi:hypothetical protein
MAFKVASQKAQAALRRILPSYLSNYKEDLTNAQKLECLYASYYKLMSDNAVLKMATNAQQRFEYAENLLTIKSLWEEIRIVANDIKEEKRLKHEEKTRKQNEAKAIKDALFLEKQKRRDRICLDVIKEMNLIPKETWPIIGEEVERRLNG